MKKLFTLICTGVFMSALGAAFTACNSEPTGSDPAEIGIAPVPTSEIPDEVADFFGGNADRIARSIFNSGDISKYIGRCVMINRVEELPAVIGYDGKPLQYPVFDFEAYTLVVGQCIGGGALYIISQRLVVENEKEATINVVTGLKEGLYDAVIHLVPFWGLYPKFDAESLLTNVTIKTKRS